MIPRRWVLPLIRAWKRSSLRPTLLRWFWPRKVMVGLELGVWKILFYPSVLFNFLRARYEERTSAVVRRSLPYLLEIELTNRCNLKCVHCLHGTDGSFKKTALSLEKFKQILAQFPHATRINLNGLGEFVMNPEFAEIIRHIRQTRPYCRITTYSNGTLLSGERARKLLGSGLSSLTVSLDAATAATYSKVRGGDFDAVVRNVRDFLTLRNLSGRRAPLVYLSYTMVDENEGEFSAFVQLAADLGVDQISGVRAAHHDWGKRQHRSRASYVREALAGHRLARRLGVRVSDYWLSDPDALLQTPEYFTKFSCPLVRDMAQISADGHWLLCCVSALSTNYAYGSLLERPALEIFNSEKYQHNRAALQTGEFPNPVCERCYKKQAETYLAGEPGGQVFWPAPLPLLDERRDEASV